MDITTYRASLPDRSTRSAFCSWLTDELSPYGLTFSVPFLRDLESGRSVPSLPMAVAIEMVTGGVLGVREWPGLKMRLKNRSE